MGLALCVAQRLSVLLLLNFVIFVPLWETVLILP